MVTDDAPTNLRWCANSHMNHMLPHRRVDAAPQAEAQHGSAHIAAATSRDMNVVREVLASPSSTEDN
jgi:hypothetical protein